METVVGVFHTRGDATRAISYLRAAGFQDISFLTPGATEEGVNAVPTSTTEQPGMAKAVGGVVGAALGVAGGLELGVLAATTVMTGVGPVVAVGMAAAAVLGLAGSLAGAAGGAKLEKEITGVPADELYVYQDALRKGRSVLFLQSSEKYPSDELRKLMQQSGAESVDVAREAWWIGLRSAEQEHYQVAGGHFERDEHAYRAGFEAGVDQRDPKLVREAISKYAPSTDQEAFRHGYERGWAHRAGTTNGNGGGAPLTTEQFQKADEAIDEASEESFPASDPPSH